MGLNRVRMGRKDSQVRSKGKAEVRKRKQGLRQARNKQREGLSKDRREVKERSPSRSVCQAWKGWRFRLEALFL